jgi:hypothetical protein
LPKHAFNLLARYQVPTPYGTVGAILNNVVTGPFYLDYGNYLNVPWQYQMDLTFFYKTPDGRFEARLALLNLTGEHNWSPPNPIYGNDSVVAEWPFHVEGTLTFRF